jgi:hypothetical protein
VEVVTEGILLQRLQRDPELAGVGAVILDEVRPPGSCRAAARGVLVPFEIFEGSRQVFENRDDWRQGTSTVG